MSNLPGGVQPPNSLPDWATEYLDKPVIRALISFAAGSGVPILGGATAVIDSFLSTRLKEIQSENFRELCNELAKGEQFLTKELVMQDDFIYGFVAITRASMRARNKAKIRRFARLLLNAAKGKKLNSDLVYEFTQILEDLSDREFAILILLQDFEDNNPFQVAENQQATGELETDLQRATRYWNNFESQVEISLGIDKLMLQSILNRLNRTGLYANFTGMYLDYTGGKGHLTPLFYEFISWIREDP